LVAALRHFGLKPGNVVGIGHPHHYLHWLTVLAFEALGVTTFSYEQDETGILEAALATADLVMCAPGHAPPNARRVQILDSEWIDSLRDQVPEWPVQTASIGPDTPMRIVKNSGTTGSLKRMVHTARVREFWIRQYQVRTGFNRHSRYLMTMGFSVEAFHAYAATCIRMGGTCVYDGRDGIGEVLAAQVITHITMPPFLLTQVLANLPDGYVKAPDLTVFTIGAPVSTEVRDRVEQVLATEIVESYGTQEMAVICTMGEDGVGTVFPGVRVETVAEDGRPVLGEPGLVRVMSAGMVDGYLDNPEATAQMFRDGWFYPGDLAVMDDTRTLRLIGRVDDLLNIQGFKFAPGPLEEKLRAALPVTDLCLAAIADDAGVEQLCVVAAPRDPDSLTDIRRKLDPLMPDTVGTVRFVAVASIPRTTTGKVRRNELAQSLRQSPAKSETR
jgi:acyl-coenzyme A synthetase/AMP-(fatty) acid ligase